MRGKKQFPQKIQFVLFSVSDFLCVGSDFLMTSKTPRLGSYLEPCLQPRPRPCQEWGGWVHSEVSLGHMNHCQGVKDDQPLD